MLNDVCCKRKEKKKYIQLKIITPQYILFFEITTLSYYFAQLYFHHIWLTLNSNLTHCTETWVALKGP